MEKQPCEYAGGTCYEMPDVGCDYHGEEALKNKTGYYAVKSMPNKEPTKEWRGLAQEILDTVGSTKAARSKAWKENALQYIEIRIEEALKVREAELIEKVGAVKNFINFDSILSKIVGSMFVGKPEIKLGKYLNEDDVIALIKG